MSREIIFRAKSLKTNEFVFGFFGQRTETSPVRETTQTYTINYILVDNGFCGFEEIEIDIKTLGQYTGFVDINGIKIFEGDVVSVCYDRKDQDCWEAVVEWCKINPSFFLKKVNPPCFFKNEYDFVKCGLLELLVIGNIHKHKELITGVKNV